MIPESSPNSPTICRATLREAPAALRLVLSKLPTQAIEDLVAGVVNVAAGDALGWGELWHAVDLRGATIGACWAQVRPGGAAVVWPPQWLPARGREGDSAGVDPLLAAVLSALEARGVSIVQSLLSETQGDEAVVLQRAGFGRPTLLKYLSCDVEAAAASDRPAKLERQLAFEPYRAGDRDRLAAIVERTYEGTLDCPALNGFRAAADMLDEYCESSTAEDAAGDREKPSSDRGDLSNRATQWWRLVRCDDRDVGCLLLADHPSYDHIELVYMGLVPEYRGRGFAEAIVAEALRIAALLRRRQVVLAVDAQNFPAVRAYGRAGFTMWETRIVFLKLSSVGPSE